MLPAKVNPDEEPSLRIVVDDSLHRATAATAPVMAELLLDDEAHPAEHAVALGRTLATFDNIYGAADGLLKVTDHQLQHIRDGHQLARLILDHVLITFERRGKKQAGMPSISFLNTTLGAELFLKPFPRLDLATAVPMYLPGFQLTTPGYNDAGPGQRILYTGKEASIEDSPDAVSTFLDVMAFDSNADRTNAVAAGLTVMLRNHWPGAKPIIVATSTKSHGGKDTVIQFASGGTPHLQLSYQTPDWPLERAFDGAIRSNPKLGLITIENARPGRGARHLHSAFVERFITDPRPFLFTTANRTPVRITNYFVLALSTNFGTVSEDLMNRALPIHLAPVGNIADRESPIGNPKLEFLPANRERIEAELRGMIERWKQAGMPLDEKARHPFTAWARTIGGILRVSGFEDFLGNYAMRRTSDDPVRRAIALLGAAYPEEWLTPTEWAKRSTTLGVNKALVSDVDRGSDESLARGVGIVLSAHVLETFVAETDADIVTVRLEKARRRFGREEASTRYRFVVLQREPLAEDAPGPQQD